MLHSQADRTRLTVWKQLLVGTGGTAARGDTLYVTIRKLAQISGASIPNGTSLPMLEIAKQILTLNGGTPTRNDTLYSVTRKLAIATGSTVACCALPPIQILGDTSSPTPPEPPADIVLGGEGGGTVLIAGQGSGGVLIGAE